MPRATAADAEATTTAAIAPGGGDADAAAPAAPEPTPPVKIAVFCGSSRRSGAADLADAQEIGRCLAERGHTLVYGGGRTGLMGAAADGSLAAGGRVEGAIYDGFLDSDVHHEGLHELAVTSDMRSRKAGLDDRSDAFIALPGGLGTFEELTEILSFRKLGFHQRPVVLLNRRSFWDPLLALVDRAIDDGFDKPAVRDYLRVATTAQDAVAACERPLGSGR